MWRYALYFTPREDSAWWRFGVSWLGRDPASGRPVAQPAVAGIAADAFRTLTEAPRRYGFHATLKAPFGLRAGATREALAAAVERFCASRAAFSIPRLEVTRTDDFLALGGHILLTVGKRRPTALRTGRWDLLRQAVRQQLVSHIIHERP